MAIVLLIKGAGFSLCPEGHMFPKLEDMVFYLGIVKVSGREKQEAPRQNMDCMLKSFYSAIE